MRAYSMDLRERVVEAAERKEGTRAELAARFRVSAGWVKKMLSQWRRLGTLRPQTHRCGRKPRLSEADLARLAELVREDPDATLSQLRERLGVACCLPTIWKALRRMKRSYKKKRAGRRTGPAGRRGRPHVAPPTGQAGRPRAAAFV